MSNLSNSSSIDEIIQQVKQEFKSFLIKRRELVLKLGNAFEKVVANPESICEEIKNVLQDEIAEKVISSRNIEMYCLSKWKRKTKPKNERISFSNKQRKEKEPIAIDNNGNPVENCTSPSEYVDNDDDEDNNGNLQTSNYCERCEILEKKCETLQVKIEDYEDALKKALPIMSADQITTTNDKINSLNSDLLYEKSDIETFESHSYQVMDFEASIQWITMQRHLNFVYKSGKPLVVWFNGKIDRITGNVITAYPGRISERNKIENEEDSETTTT
jgi:PHD/YefM family antitoxin component YafN of YafNO toxin-antitoxin module